MPHYRRQFINGEIYHITVRRIGNEILSGDEQDLLRLIYGIYEFNNKKPVSIARRRQQRAAFKKFKEAAIKEAAAKGLTLDIHVLGQPSYNSQLAATLIEPDKREKFVEVLAFALMPNHIHLLVRQLVDRGVSNYMQKFGSGYASWFKEKYEQKTNGKGKGKSKGHFFQDRFNAVHIEDDDQLRTVLVYIFTNPVALIEPGWKERGVANVEKSIHFLENDYRWSSYWDVLGKKNFPSITAKEMPFVLEIMGGAAGCKDAVDQWIKYKGELRRLLAKSFTMKLIEQLE